MKFAKLGQIRAKGGPPNPTVVGNRLYYRGNRRFLEWDGTSKAADWEQEVDPDHGFLGKDVLVHEGRVITFRNLKSRGAGLRMWAVEAGSGAPVWDVTFPFDPRPLGLALWKEQIWFSGFSDVKGEDRTPVLAQIDPSTGELIARHSIPKLDELVPDGDTLWLAGRAGLYQIDAVGGPPVERISGATFGGILPHETHLIAYRNANKPDAAIVAIDRVTFDETSRLEGDFGPGLFAALVGTDSVMFCPQQCVGMTVWNWRNGEVVWQRHADGKLTFTSGFETEHGWIVALADEQFMSEVALLDPATGDLQREIIADRFPSAVARASDRWFMVGMNTARCFSLDPD